MELSQKNPAILLLESLAEQSRLLGEIAVEGVKIVPLSLLIVLLLGLCCRILLDWWRRIIVFEPFQVFGTELDGSYFARQVHDEILRFRSNLGFGYERPINEIRVRETLIDIEVPGTRISIHNLLNQIRIALGFRVITGDIVVTDRSARVTVRSRNGVIQEAVFHDSKLDEMRKFAAASVLLAMAPGDLIHYNFHLNNDAGLRAIENYYRMEVKGQESQSIMAYCAAMRFYLIEKWPRMRAAAIRFAWKSLLAPSRLNNLSNSISLLAIGYAGAGRFRVAIALDRLLAILYFNRNPIILNNLGADYLGFAIQCRNRGDEENERKLLRKSHRSHVRSYRMNPRSATQQSLWGETFAAQGKKREAERLFRSALMINPRLETAYNARGNFYFQQGKYRKAIEMYSQASDLAPNDPYFISNRAMALYYVETGKKFHLANFEGVIELSRRALRIRPDHAPAYKAWGLVEIERNHYRRALRLFRRGAGLDHADPDFPAYTGACLNNLRRHAEARDVLKEAVQKNPRNNVAHNNLGYAYLDLGNAEEAERSFKRALEIFPNYSKSLNGLGIRERNDGRMKAALEWFDQAVNADPENYHAQINRGNACEELEDYQGAIESFRRAAEIRPDLAEPIYYWGVTLGKLRRDKDSMEKYRKAIDLDPGHGLAYNNWGVTLDEMGKHKEAIQKYESSIQANPDLATPYLNWGVSLGNSGQYEEALEKLKQAVGLDRTSESATIGIAFCLMNLNVPRAALSYFCRTLTLNLNNGGAYRGIGRALSKCGNQERAGSFFEKSLQINNDDVDALLGLSNILIDRGDVMEAEQWLKPAVKKKGVNAQVLLNYSIVLNRNGRSSEALVVLERALEKEPKNANMHRMKGFVLKNRGRFKAAKSEFRLSLKLEPGNPVALKALKDMGK